jgi:cell division protein FtsI (penicillin-binding protein 3)
VSRGPRSTRVSPRTGSVARSRTRPAVRRSAHGPSRPHAPTRPPGRRLVALLAVLAVGFSGILFRLVVLQVKDASALEGLALKQRLQEVALPATRGTIYDRNDQALAMSLPAKAVYADPALVTDAAGEAAAIARTLGLDAITVQAELTETGADGSAKRFVYVARGVDVATAKRLADQDLAGIGFLGESRRVFPAGELAPQVLGFVGTDGTGLAGLEYQYQRILAGRSGRQVFQEDPNGTLIPQAGSTAIRPVPGDDLVLTIDREIQYRAQEALATAVKQNHAAGGTIVVMDPRTGEVLAMASYPWFDPNRFSDANPQLIRNRAVTDMYEPGSVNKVITAAAAIEEHVLNLNQRFKVPDQLQVSDHRYSDAEPHPTEDMTLADIIAYSSNIGTIKVASLLGQDRFAAYLDRFGFGNKTGIDFPGEASGLLPTYWSGTSMGSIPIGQGISVTPLQMSAVYATIANGGVWVQPHLVQGTVDAAGRFVPAPAPATHRVVSEETAATVTRLLAYAVDVGTGQQAQIPGYWVAGKTGTARKPLPNQSGYYEDRYVASFIGFAPAAHPAILVAAVLDSPSTVFGGIASAPLFRDVGRFALARLRVPPAGRLPIPPHAIPSG